MSTWRWHFNRPDISYLSMNQETSIQHRAGPNNFAVFLGSFPSLVFKSPLVGSRKTLFGVAKKCGGSPRGSSGMAEFNPNFLKNADVGWTGTNGRYFPPDFDPSKLIPQKVLKGSHR